MTAPTGVHALVTNLAACLCAELTEMAATDDDVLAPCFCGVVVGAQVANDSFTDCEENDGFAWVRLVSSYPSEETGVPSLLKQNWKKPLGIDIEMGVERTLAFDADDLTISAVQYAEMFAQEVKDMKALYRAIKCCFGATQTDAVVVGQWTPSGPLGMTYGGTITLFVQVGV